MEKFETFTAYVHGELSTADEEQFFAKMSYDAELRSDFRRFVAVENSMKKSAASFIPPNSVTNAIYTELGFSLPAAATGAITSGGITVLISKAMLAGLSSIISIAATILLLHFFTNTNNIVSDKNNLIANNNSKSQIQNNLSTENPSKDAINSNLIPIGEKKSNFKKISNKIYNRDLAFNPKKESIKNPNESVKTSIAQEPLQSKNNEYANSFMEKVKQPSNQFYQDVPINTNADRTQSDNGIIIGIIGTINWNPVTENINTAHLSKLNNFGLFAEKRLTDDFAAGIDLRQETFYLKYEGSENNVHYKYEQKPNLTTIGIIAEYRLINLSGSDISLQAGAGANYYGYTGRLSLNFNYLYDSHIRFFAGSELNEFIFKYQSQSFTSQKINLNFGLKYNF